MGTRCVTRVFEGDEQICAIYRHFDGYPDGHGKELWEFVSGLRVVNGYCSAATIPKSRMANGAGRMAAMIITHFAENDPAVLPPSITSCGEDYEYRVKCPTIEMIDALKAGRNYDGLPAIVEAYSVRGGYGDVPRTLERVTIPGAAAEPDEDRSSQATGGGK
jgi:hypothetical protein